MLLRFFGKRKSERNFFNSFNAKNEKPEKIQLALCATPEKPENQQLNICILNYTLSQPVTKFEPPPVKGKKDIAHQSKGGLEKRLNKVNHGV